MKINYKLLLGGSLLGILAMGLMAGNVTERENERISLTKSPSVASAD